MSKAKLIKFTFEVTSPSPVYNHTYFEACGWCYFGGVCAPSESEDSSRCVCAPGYYGSHCQGEQIIFDTLLRISRNYIFYYFNVSVVKIIQCEYSNVRVTTIVSTVDHVKWMRLKVRCSVETVTPDLQDHSVIVSLRFLLFKKKYHALVNSMKQNFVSL